ncbi:MAG TPA: GNAT family N-acetyltransferase [Xanthomonadaceae bacterium]|jgi:predicted GNAT superfamily acetyltransferase|nr:GNAT family N-acetyltransferase [Xanthomonadaceae bacterium]
MRMVIRDVREHELDSVLALNNAAGAGILPIDAERLHFFWRHAAYFRVAEADGHLAGFLIALMPDVDYDSPNFIWFRERYPEFVYIDRIVIAGEHRGAGLGRVFYADVQSFAEVRTPRLACEVFVSTGRDPALLFHGSFGFREVGQQVIQGLGLRASYLVKDLCSFPWVRETYLHADAQGLPEVDWLRARAPTDAGARDVPTHPVDHPPQRATGT